MSEEKLSKTNEVSCDSCTAACCRAGSLLVLSKSEEGKHRKAMGLRALIKIRSHDQAAMVQSEGIRPDGTKYPVPMPISVPAGHGAFLMEKDCGRLDGNNCGIYNERPQACREYKVGSAACLEARTAAGLDKEQVSE